MSEGLRDDITSEPPVSDGGEQSAPEPTWWWDKDTPGDGERPEWLPGKYKSVEDTAKAFKELEKRLGSAPDKYDWSKGSGWIDEAYEPLQEMAEFAKSNHVPQAVFDKMLESVGTYLDEFNTDYEAEKAALGENAESRLKTVDNWAKANFSEDAYGSIIGNLRTAGDVKAIEEIRAKMIDNNTKIPTGNEVAEAPLDMEAVQTELNANIKKYETDKAYRAEIEAKIRKAVGG
jgi:hypothetical protein